jgi:hypothetical protein
MLYRFLQANEFSGEKTYKSLRDYEEWIKTLPVVLDEETRKFLV